MRVLDHRKGVPPLEEIGMSAAALEEVREFLRHQHGMILVVGPTGSGKTTTLSSALKSVQSEKTNIITIEDPIEYQIPGVNQTQINEKIKLTFASALRSILRQDPDVILVGEIRDAETAKIAMQAAQTGPPRAVDAAHRRCAVGRDAADGHRRRAVRHRVGAGRRRRAAAGAAAVRALPPPVHAAGRHAALAEHRRRPTRRRFRSTSRSAAISATTPATAAASASTK